MRIALVEGGRAGMWGGTESVRVAADMRVGRRDTRRCGRSILGCVSSDGKGEVAKVLILSWRGPELRAGED